MATTVHALWIISASGGLLFSKSYSTQLPVQSANELLIAAGTFHGIDAIASRISPVSGSSGVQVVDAEAFRMTCLRTPTGIKFILLASPSHPAADSILHRAYQAYAAYLQNPFYNSDMPLRGEVFERAMAHAVA